MHNRLLKKQAHKCTAQGRWSREAASEERDEERGTRVRDRRGGEESNEGETQRGGGDGEEGSEHGRGRK